MHYRRTISKGLIAWLLCALPLYASAQCLAGQTMADVAARWIDKQTLRDGVKLATDIYRPARNAKAVEGRFPVILERTRRIAINTVYVDQVHAAHVVLPLVAMSDLKPLPKLPEL